MSSIAHIACMAALSGLIALAASGARAQEPPNLIGTWKGSTQAVYIGSNPSRVAEKAGPNFSTNLIEFTYSITEQKGNVFAGTSGGTVSSQSEPARR